MLKQFTRIAWRNILYSPRKSLLAILAVASCYLCLTLFQGYIAGTEVIFLDSTAKRNMLGNFIIRRVDGERHSSEEADLLDANEQTQITETLKSLGGVDVYMRFLRISGTITNGTAQMVFTGHGYDVEAGRQMRSPTWTWNALAGNLLNEENPSQFLIGRTLGSLMGCTTQETKNYMTGRGGYEATVRPMECQTTKFQLQTATMSGQANAVEAEVVGIMDAMFRDLDLRALDLPLPLAQRLLDTDRVSFYSVRLLPSVDEEKFIISLNKELKARNLKVIANSWKKDDMGDFYQRTMGFLHMFRNFMVFVILAVALLSIFNTFYRSVQERIREIGVLRTLGFRITQVRALFLLETFFLALVGVVIGGVLAVLSSAVANHSPLFYKIGLLTQPVPLILEITPLTMLLNLILVIIVAVLAAFIPLVITGKMRITDALAHT